MSRESIFDVKKSKMAVSRHFEIMEIDIFISFVNISPFD